MHVANPIWRALATRQAHLGTHAAGATKFDKDVSLLGGLADTSDASFAAMASLLAPGERVGLFLDADLTAPPFELLSGAPLLQMIHAGGALPANPAEIAPLTEADVPEMMALTELTKPGPFNRRTREMGDYAGLRSGGVLVAMAGERLHVPGYTEVSAICTHPDHLGRGHAAALTTWVMRRIVERGETPMLHVRPENTRAVALYERLGFEPRWTGRYVILQRS